MAPKPKKLTKKQEQELQEKLKQEAKEQKLRELEKKKAEEERQKKIEEKKYKLEEEINSFKEEKNRLEKEERALQETSQLRETKFKKFFNQINDYYNWKDFSECTPGYIDVRREKEITAFIHEFEEKIDTPMYINCMFIEKNIPEELLYFEYISNHFQRLSNLYYEGASTNNNQQVQYCVKYLDKMRNLVNKKIHYMTKYFLENFVKIGDMHMNPSKYKLGQNSVEKTNNAFADMCIEWVSNNFKDIRLGFWCNNNATSREATISNFRFIPCKVQYLPSQCVTSNSIIRFVYSEFDDKELTSGYFPYITLNGLFKLNYITYPAKSITHKNWEIKELINDDFYLNLTKDSYGQQIRMTVIISIDNRIFLRDLDETKTFIFGRYNEDTKQWLIDPEHSVILDKEQRTAIFKEYSEINTFTLLLDKKHILPYKDWYIRSIIRQRSVMDFETRKMATKTLYIGLINVESKQFINIIYLKP